MHRTHQRPSSRSLAHVVAILGLSASPALAQPQRYDFSEVAQLAAGAVVGTGVSTPVPGFELLLLKDGLPVFHDDFGSWTIGRVAAADSATKTLSGALIMSLVERSAQPFTLQSRLSQFIPAFAGVKSNVTFAQAFAHTAGFRSSDSVSSNVLTLQQAALDIADDPQLFSGGSFVLPGTAFSYGGTSMHAAGAAAEAAGGLLWNTLFDERIRLPLGLTNTRFVLTSPTNPRIAGGCESTAAEFAVFMEMLRNNGLHQGQRILLPLSVQTLFTRQTPVGIPILNTPVQTPYTDGADYGVGVWLDERDAAGTLLGALAAGARGFSSWIDFDDGMVGVFATDTTNSGNIQPLLYRIRDAAQRAVRSPDPCVADVDGDGAVTADDVFWFIDEWFAAGPGSPCTAAVPALGCIADWDGSRRIDTLDLFAFLDDWFAAGPGSACR